MPTAKETGMLFGADLIPKILDGSKTQTRRTYGLEKINKNPDDWKSIYPDGDGGWIAWDHDAPGLAEFTKKAYPRGGFKCPYGGVGDLLWVKETHNLGATGQEIPVFKAGLNQEELEELEDDDRWTGWKSPRFMFKKYARIWLEITGLRPERLQEITEADAKAEGYTDRYDFMCGWDKINGKRGYPWVYDYWVWRLEFKRIRRLCH